MSNRVWMRIFGLLLIVCSLIPLVGRYFSLLRTLAAPGGIDRVDQQVADVSSGTLSTHHQLMAAVGLLLLVVSCLLKKQRVTQPTE